jgi:acyl-CoA thioester hydrolase
VTKKSSTSRLDFFRYRLRVRHSEIDGQSVVFNSRYLEYADVAIAEYLRKHRILIASGPDTPEFHVAKATVEYKSPIRIDEEIELWVRTRRMGRSTWTLVVEIRGSAKDGLHRIDEPKAKHEYIPRDDTMRIRDSLSPMGIARAHQSKEIT